MGKVMDLMGLSENFLFTKSKHPKTQSVWQFRESLRATKKLFVFLSLHRISYISLSVLSSGVFKSHIKQGRAAFFCCQAGVHPLLSRSPSTRYQQKAPSIGLTLQLSILSKQSLSKCSTQIPFITSAASVESGYVAYHRGSDHHLLLFLRKSTFGILFVFCLRSIVSVCHLYRKVFC